MDEFENLLEAERVSVERFVRFRMTSKADADDVLQEVYLTAYQKFHQLKNKDAFKAWIISIARNKCNDYFRKKAAQYEFPVDELTEKDLSDSRHGISVVNTVRETLSLLGEKMSWGMYDVPSRKCSHVYDMQVTGKAKVHGIEGVELTAREAFQYC